MNVTVSGRSPLTGQGLAVTIEDGVIARLAPARVPPDGPMLSRGLVDLQVNGFGGVDFNGAPPSPEEVLDLCRKLAAEGVTRFLATVITGAPDAMLAAMRAVGEARAAVPLCEAMIAGLHVEGPSISPLDGPRGAHPAEHVRPPSLAEFEAWQAVSGGLVRLVTLAPEHEGALEYIAALSARGVIVAIGHSAATPAQIHRAAEAGARMSTHLGNGVAGTLPRHPNLLWAQLADDRLTAGLIADGHHLPADTFRTMLRAKGVRRAVLVSDSVRLAGMAPGRYRQPVGDEVELTEDGRVVLAGTPYLAGAATSLAQTVPRAARMAGVPLGEVLMLAAEAPATLLGLGGLVVGAEADLILFSASDDGRLVIHETWTGGRRTFDERAKP